MQPNDEPTADVEIVASAAADELRFHVEPAVRVSFAGTGARDSRQITTRANIDMPVQPGKTYQRVFVTTRISSRLVNGHRTDEGDSRPATSPPPRAAAIRTQR
jgi:hypothetical protein